MKNSGKAYRHVITRLKLRGSYGMVGNDNIEVNVFLLVKRNT